MVLVANRKFLAAFGAAVSQYLAATGACHALAETMLVVSFAVVGLKCTFHILFFYYCRPFELAKVHIFWESARCKAVFLSFIFEKRPCEGLFYKNEEA